MSRSTIGVQKPLDQPLLDILQEMAQERGITQSELVRRVILDPDVAQELTRRREALNNPSGGQAAG